MLKKKLSIIFVILMFVISAIFIVPHDKIYSVVDIYSPAKIKLNKGEFVFNDLQTFDPEFSEHNKALALSLNISEEEAFVLGNLAKYWAENLIKDRKIILKENLDLIYYKYSYRNKFLYSGFCIKDSKPYYKEAYEKRLLALRRAKYKVYDIENEKVYDLEDAKVRSLKNFVLVRKSQISKIQKSKAISRIYSEGDIKIIFADSTTNLRPYRNCSTEICKEILYNINNAHKTIDIAIYGYSSVPAIEKALKEAIGRGVKVRLVCDSDGKGGNIYPDTPKITALIKENKTDENSSEAKNIMHNKFYIFDDKVLITGSANLSHTDMSGFNSNSVLRINSKEVAEIYKKEFEQMLKGKFHNEKSVFSKNNIMLNGNEIKIYFSPQDKSITNAVLPIIRAAKHYIYIPTFVLTEKRVTEELINAKKRGVDVRIIIDALNASIRHSKHNELRVGGIQVKTENYAGKMHSKSMIVDDKYTIVGSMNFSYSGENKNDENLIVIKNSNISKFYKEFFLYQWERIDDKWLKYNVRAESKDSIGSCFDGIDNNYDGLIDSEDPACRS